MSSQSGPILAFPNAYIEVNAESKRDIFTSCASIIFLIFGAASAISNFFLVGFIIDNHTAPVLPFIGRVLDERTPVGVAWGWNAVIGFGVLLILVSILEVLAGVWLWRSRRRGGMLGAALQPANFVFAYGLGIPILYLLPPLWLLLIWLGWTSLR